MSTKYFTLSIYLIHNLFLTYVFWRQMTNVIDQLRMVPPEPAANKSSK